MAAKIRTHQKNGNARRGKSPLRRKPEAKKKSPRVKEPVSILQPKLEVGAAHDAYEQEANRVAEHVMGNQSAGTVQGAQPNAATSAMPSIVRRVPANKVLNRACSSCGGNMKTNSIAQRTCAKCAGHAEGKAAPFSIAQRHGTGEGFKVDPGTEESIAALRGSGGRALPEGERSFFENRMGYDFGNVRVHSGPRAAEASRRVNARAFTIGRDVVFGDGQYQPGTFSGRKLLAHELTHTVQQGAAARSTSRASTSTSPAKQTASSPQPKISRMPQTGRAPNQINRFFGGILGPSSSSKKKKGKRKIPTQIGGHKISDLKKIPSAGELMHTPRGQAVGKAVGRDLMSRYSMNTLMSVAEKQGVVQRVEGGDFAGKNSTVQKKGERIQRVVPVGAGAAGVFVVAGKALGWLAAAAGTVVAAVAGAPLWVIIAVIAIAVLLIAGAVWYFTSLDDAPAPVRVPKKADEEKPVPGGEKKPGHLPEPGPLPDGDPIEDPNYGCVCCADDIRAADLAPIVNRVFYGHRFNVRIDLSYLPPTRIPYMRSPCRLQFMMFRSPPFRGADRGQYIDGMRHSAFSGRPGWNGWRTKGETCSSSGPVSLGPFEPRVRRVLPDGRTPIPGRYVERRKYRVFVSSGGAGGGRPCLFRRVALYFDQTLKIRNGRPFAYELPRFRRFHRI